MLEGYYFLRTLCARRELTKYGIGSWVLITGSTDGIGLGFAKVLAKYGFNIISISRNPQKLKKVEQELKEFNIQVLSIVKDFSKCTENSSEFFNDIDQQTQHLDVSLVINNIGTSILGYFHELSTKELLIHNSLNLWSIVYLSKLFLKRMLKRNRPSGLINLSSVASVTPLGGMTTYCAGKSFDHLFTLDLNEEIRYLIGKENLQNIDILSFQPGFVDTPLIHDFSEKPLLINPETCAETALRILGKINYSSGHWKHLILATLYKNMFARQSAINFLHTHFPNKKFN